MTISGRRESYAAVEIRWMIRRDMPEVMNIERLSWELPLTEDELLYYLKQRPVIGMVAESKGRVIGFMIYELSGERLQLHHLAIHPFHRRRGIGSLMIEKLEYKLAQQKRRELFMEVSEDNFAAHMFLRVCGVEAN